jgi:carotenoid 1,2-hydratase
MTERSRASVERGASHFRIGPSALRWTGDRLLIDIDEVGAPLPRAVRGRITVHPSALNNFSTALDDGGRHRWGPIAACARVEVELARPAARWSGHAYFDSNEGDEPIDRPFVEWDWSRATLRSGSTAVIYDVQQKAGADRLLALKFSPSGAVEPFEAPPRQPLPRTLWRMARRMRSDAGVVPTVVQRLEDAPFYSRAVLRSGLLGETVTSMHETLNVPRLVSPAVQSMLPWRMPRTR